MAPGCTVYRLVLALTCVVVCRSVGVCAEVETLDGRRASGDIMAWDVDGVRLSTASGDSTMFTAGELLRVKLAEMPSQPSSATQLLLSDGSSIGATQIVVDRENATAAVELKITGNVDWVFATDDVRAVRLQSPSDLQAAEARELLRQWSEMIAKPAIADLLVIRKPGGTALQPIEGAIGEISASTAKFTLSDEPVDVNRDRVYGAIYYRAKVPDVGDAVVLATTSGQQLVGKSARLIGNQLELVRANSESIRVAVGDVANVDYSPGRLKFLSDIEPHRVDVTSPIVEPDGAVLAWWHPRRDQNFAGKRLTLAYPASPDVPQAGLPRFETFDKGIAVRGPSSVTYRLPPGYKRLVATVGIDPTLRRSVHTAWEWTEGDRVMARGVGDRQTPPAEIEIDIDGVREITLKLTAVDDETSGPSTSPAMAPLVIQFCNARLLK